LFYKTLLSLFVVLFLSACSHKVSLTTIKPANITLHSEQKKVSVNPFKQDSVGLSSKIEVAMGKVKIQDQNYFTLVNRKELLEVLQEHKLQSSELIDPTTVTQLGKLIGAQTMVSGELSNVDAHTSYYYEPRKKCVLYSKEKGCLRYKYYQTRCERLYATLSATISLIDVASAQILYADTFDESKTFSSCYGALSYSGTQVLNFLADTIAQEFVDKISPSYTNYSVEILDSLDLDTLSDTQEDRFEYALEFLELQRYDKAEEILGTLFMQSDSKSYVIAYNLGVVYEARNKLIDAKELYKTADTLSYEPNEAINKALVRIEQLLAQQQTIKKQIDVP